MHSIWTLFSVIAIVVALAAASIAPVGFERRSALLAAPAAILATVLLARLGMWPPAALLATWPVASIVVWLGRVYMEDVRSRWDRFPGGVNPDSVRERPIDDLENNSNDLERNGIDLDRLAAAHPVESSDLRTPRAALRR